MSWNPPDFAKFDFAKHDTDKWRIAVIPDQGTTEVRLLDKNEVKINSQDDADIQVHNAQCPKVNLTIRKEGDKVFVTNGGSAINISLDNETLSKESPWQPNTYLRIGLYWLRLLPPTASSPEAVPLQQSAQQQNAPQLSAAEDQSSFDVRPGHHIVVIQPGIPIPCRELTVTQQGNIHTRPEVKLKLDGKPYTQFTYNWDAPEGVRKHEFRQAEEQKGLQITLTIPGTPQYPAGKHEATVEIEAKAEWHQGGSAELTLDVQRHYAHALEAKQLGANKRLIFRRTSLMVTLENTGNISNSYNLELLHKNKSLKVLSSSPFPLNTPIPLEPGDGPEQPIQIEAQLPWLWLPLWETQKIELSVTGKEKSAKTSVANKENPPSKNVKFRQWSVLWIILATMFFMVLLLLAGLGVRRYWLKPPPPIVLHGPERDPDGAVRFSSISPQQSTIFAGEPVTVTWTAPGATLISLKPLDSSFEKKVIEAAKGNYVFEEGFKKTTNLEAVASNNASESDPVKFTVNVLPCNSPKARPQALFIPSSIPPLSASEVQKVVDVEIQFKGGAKISNVIFDNDPDAIGPSGGHKMLIINETKVFKLIVNGIGCGPWHYEYAVTVKPTPTPTPTPPPPTPTPTPPKVIKEFTVSPPEIDKGKDVTFDWTVENPRNYTLLLVCSGCTQKEKQVSDSDKGKIKAKLNDTGEYHFSLIIKNGNSQIDKEERSVKASCGGLFGFVKGIVGKCKKGTKNEWIIQ